MACSEKQTWDIDLVKGGSFKRVLTFEDEEETAIDFAGMSFVMVVKPAGNSLSPIEWTGSDFFQIVSPASNGKVSFTLSKTVIDALAFKSARFFMFFVTGGTRSEEQLSGTIQVK